MVAKLGQHSIPALWRRMLDPDVFELHFPDEKEATCSNCPSVVKHGFTQPYRCCTYIPRIPNFLVGAALADPATAPFARRGLERYGLPDGVQVGPLGYKNSLAEYGRNQYGKSAVIRCPFLDADLGRCGIYAYRNSVCSTYFCWNDHGMRGHMFWEKVQGLMGQIETALAQWCITQLGGDLDHYFGVWDSMALELDACSDQEGWAKSIKERLFEFWQGTDEEFFVACHKLVSDPKHDLYQIARGFQLKDSRKFNSAFYAWLPESMQTELDKPRDEIGRPIAIDTLWYELKLYHRNLWQLPFGESAHGLSSRAKLAPNPGADAVDQFYRDRPMKLTFRASGSPTEIQFEIYLTHLESKALELFQKPQVFDASLFEKAEIRALKSPRTKLAEWLRLGLLEES